MRVEFSAGHTSRRGKCAFTLIETLVGLCVLLLVLVSLFAGMSASFSITQVSRENLRATQIMLERMETVRLYTWNQLLYSNMIPATATTSYYPLATNGESSGITYQVNYALANAAMIPAATYSDRLRAVTVTVWWTNYYGPKPQTNTIVRSRTMTTYSARDGVQNYVYNN
jgi:type II secretory pathway pseudopilin PulG